MLVKYFLLSSLGLIITAIILYNPQFHNVFAISPSFSRQGIPNAPDHWSIIKAPQNVTVIQTSSGIRSPIGLANDAAECTITQEQYNVLPPGISAVTYLSNGKTLNATLWLSHPFIEQPLHNDRLSIPFNGVHLYMVRYGMTLETSSVYHIPGSDYTARLQWDAINKTWDRVVEELAPVSTDETRLLEPINHNYTAFHVKGKSYINLSLDLGGLSYPNQYSVYFYALNLYIKDGTLCRVVNLTNKVYIPPPEFAISTNPNSLTLEPGDTKTIELQLKSNTKLLTNSFVVFSNRQFSGLRLNFIPNGTYIPYSGNATSLLQIKALENDTQHVYRLPIFASISFPNTEFFLPLPANSTTRANSVLSVPVENKNLSSATALSIVVSRPPTFRDLISNALDQFATFFKDSSQDLGKIIVGTFASALVALIVKRFTEKRKKGKNKTIKRS
jgi:hypothetical protein